MGELLKSVRSYFSRIPIIGTLLSRNNCENKCIPAVHISDQSTFHSIAIPLIGKYALPSDDDNEHPDHLFVGRKIIINNLVDILKSNKKRGSYLIAGYRGAGKTTVIKKTIERYQEKRGAVIVNINLGDTSQLTPLSIYYSIANILREELTEKSCYKWERHLRSLVSFKAFGIYIFLFFSALFPITWFNPGQNLPVYDYILWLIYLLGILKVMGWAISWLGHPELKYLGEIDNLIERISSEISEGRTADLRHGHFGFGVSRNKRTLPINAREAEEMLFKIFKKIQVSPVKIVIVLDEIDKISDSEELSEIQNHDKFSIQEGGKISKINTLLGALKNFITTAEATFFFISGRETLDRYYSEKGNSNSLYASLFDRVFEVPSFLTDQGERPRGTRLSALIEEYVCRQIRKKRDDKNDDHNYYSLAAYREQINNNSVLIGEFPLTTEKTRQSIYILRNFIHYLTFHSWGNPKRLSSIFESFIVLKDEVIKNKKSTLIISENDCEADHWLVFNSIHQRSFALASEISTLFSHQLGREVSKMSDKLTVSTLSSLHYILKLHPYGFNRESLSRMSEAINVYRSTELNTIIDDLLTHVFKSYIRRVRNGVYRYRFNSAFEQELRYISHGSELESATYNFSLDSMRNVKKVFEDICANSKDMDVIARSHITLGDIYAIEQSYTAASVYYSTASRLLNDILNQSPSFVNPEILMQCIEAMIKHGDLEERRQNYNLAAVIYFEADRIVKNLQDQELRNNILRGDSKLDLLKQPFWALHFLSLKRSPRPFKSNIPATGKLKLLRNEYQFERTSLLCKPELPDYLYRDDDQRFYYRAANLSLFLGEAECASNFYLQVLHILRKNHGKSKFPDERISYLNGKARVGLAESALVFQSRKLFLYSPPSKKGERPFAIKLLEGISGYSYIYHRIGKPLKIAAIGFEKNKLYVSAAIAHIKAISYYVAILDVFDSNTFHNDVESSNKLELLLKRIFEEVLERGKDAIRCINKARQLETSQNNKTYVMHDLETMGDEHEMTITKLFEMLTELGSSETYPVAEPIFWQNSLWSHKLAVTLCWAYYVKYKIERKAGDCRAKIWSELPENLPDVLSASGFSVRPTILLRWIWARNLSRRYINRKLMIIDDKKCNSEEVLEGLYKKPNDIKLTIDCGVDVVDYICSFSKEKNTREVPKTLRKAYLLSKYLYLAQESSRSISRKNLDLIFPRLPQIYFAQWKLLLNLILATLIGLRENRKESVGSIRNLAFLIQRAFTAIDNEFSPEERIAPSHFDYEFIYLRLSESLESSINIVDRTSRTHMGIFQNKYYCHDDHNDPDFKMDYTLAYMFAPRALYLHKEVIDTNQELKKTILHLHAKKIS